MTVAELVDIGAVHIKYLYPAVATVCDQYVRGSCGNSGR